MNQAVHLGGTLPKYVKKFMTLDKRKMKAISFFFFFFFFLTRHYRGIIGFKTQLLEQFLKYKNMKSM